MACVRGEYESNDGSSDLRARLILGCEFLESDEGESVFVEFLAFHKSAELVRQVSLVPQSEQLTQCTLCLFLFLGGSLTHIILLQPVSTYFS